MPKIVFHSVSLDVPETWVDMSLLTLVSGEPAAYRPSFVVSRDALAPKTLAAYVDAQVAELKKTKRYALHRREMRTQQGHQAILVEQSLATPENLQVRQLQLHVDLGDTVLTATATAADADFAKTGPGLEAMLSSMYVGT